MLSHTAQWVERAEVDWISVSALRRTKDERVIPNTCFLSHSTVEKYIKA